MTWYLANPPILGLNQLKKFWFCFQGYGDKCGQVLGSGITSQDIREILQVHNELRAKIANGLEKRGRPGPQPPAANMEQMVMFVLLFSSYALHQFFCWLWTFIQKFPPLVTNSSGSGGDQTILKLTFNCCMWWPQQWLKRLVCWWWDFLSGQSGKIKVTIFVPWWPLNNAHY